MQALQTMIDLQSATLDARKRLNDQSISVQAKNGAVRIARVRYHANGKSVVTPITGMMTPDEACEFLRSGI